MPTVLRQTFSLREVARGVADFSQFFGVELLSRGDGRERSVRVLLFRTGYGERWEGDRCYLYARGEIRQAAMYGKNLILERLIEVGTDTVTSHDCVRNLGFYPTSHARLYHINLG